MRERGIPNYIRTHRKRAQLTQEEVAFLLGSKGTAGVCRHERSRQAPNLENLLAYEILFSTPVRNLFGGVQKNVEHKLNDRIRRLVQKLRQDKPTRSTTQKITRLTVLLQEGPSTEGP